MKGSKTLGAAHSSKPIKITKGGGVGTKTLGSTKKKPAAFSAKGVSAGAGNRF
jgi:hypothetical protein